MVRGIVRRIDELGRVVVPKEIRKTLRIREGDPLEISVEQEGLYLKKYSPVKSVEEYSKSVVISLAEITESIAVVCDTDHVLSATGKLKNAVGEKISVGLENALKERKTLLLNSKEGAETIDITLENRVDIIGQIISPILLNGDLVGGVILISKDKTFDVNTVKLVTLSADFISKQLE